jgi:hypothetical protein
LLVHYQGLLLHGDQVATCRVSRFVVLHLLQSKLVRALRFPWRPHQVLKSQKYHIFIYIIDK